MTDPTPLASGSVGLLSNTMAQISRLPTHVKGAYATDASALVRLGSASDDA